MSVKLSNIYKSYGKQEILHDVSFEVKCGEITSFLGVNGAGKSTCMKIITGGLVQDKGEIYICGHNIIEDPLSSKKQIGYLPENNPLYPEMYVREYLIYVAGLYHLTNASQIVDEMIERIRLTDVCGKTIHTLSKGYRQRVGLAQSLLHNPCILILDEPFSGLDSNQLDEMHDMLRELGKEKAILFSSHSLQEVKDLCQHTIILHNHRIVADAPTEELIQEMSLEDKFKQLTQ